MTEALSEWVLVFPTQADFLAAVSLLQSKGVHFQKGANPNGYPFHFFVPPGRKSEVCYLLLQARLLLSGNYEARKTPTPQEPLPLSNAAAPDDLLRGAAIVYVSECFADETKLRLMANFSGNAREALPYLNAVLRSATYTPGGPYLTFSKGQRMITVYPEKVAVAKADDLDDGWATVNWVRELVNDTWRRRATITPSAQRRVRTTALEIFGWLPRTNCRQCGEMTCLAFAVKLLAGGQSFSRCLPLSEHDNARKKDVLAEMLGIQ
jgi:ArsR family metal-binding transcriptional regulator